MGFSLSLPQKITPSPSQRKLGVQKEDSKYATSKNRNLGHASVALTHDIYAHLTPEVMEDSAQKIVSRLFGE